MHHEHSMDLKNAKELSRGQRGAEAIEVMHCVNENIEKLGIFVSALSSSSRP